MSWSEWAQFFAMGGYALYVWGSVGMCALVVALEISLLAMRRRVSLQGARDLSIGAGASGA